ncbi:MAG: hypothetical protein WAK26_16270 [Terracidiphilus sp.]
MENDSIAKVALIGMSWNTSPRQFTPAISSPSKVDQQSAPDSSYFDTASAEASIPLNQVQNAAVSPALPVLSPPHFTSVAGKSFLLTVEEAAGTFMASVSAPAGTSATGSSAHAAEDNLDAILDTMA